MNWSLTYGAWAVPSPNLTMRVNSPRPRRKLLTLNIKSRTLQTPKPNEENRGGKRWAPKVNCCRVVYRSRHGGNRCAPKANR